MPSELRESIVMAGKTRLAEGTLYETAATPLLHTTITASTGLPRFSPLRIVTPTRPFLKVASGVFRSWQSTPESPTPA